MPARTLGQPAPARERTPTIEPDRPDPASSRPQWPLRTVRELKEERLPSTGARSAPSTAGDVLETVALARDGPITSSMWLW
jgi:hypothetical protein